MTVECITCDGCKLAEVNPLSGLYYVKCDGCKARAIAQSPQAHESRQLGAVTKDMKRVMQASFGDDWKAHLPAVQAWAKKVRA